MTERNDPPYDWAAEEAREAFAEVRRDAEAITASIRVLLAEDWAKGAEDGHATV